MFEPHVNHPDNTGYNSDPQHIGGDKRPVDLVRFKSTFCKELSIQIESYKIDGFGRYAVRYKPNKNLVGMCGFLNDVLGIDLGY